MIETYHYARFSVQTAIVKENVGGAIWQAVLPLPNNFAARAGLWPHRPLQRHGTWRRCRSAVRLLSLEHPDECFRRFLQNRFLLHPLESSTENSIHHSTTCFLT